MNLEGKVDQILIEVGKGNIAIAELKKDVETNTRDIKEIRTDFWGSGDIKKKVLDHESTLKLVKWVGSILGGAALLALFNSIFGLVVK